MIFVEVESVVAWVNYAAEYCVVLVGGISIHSNAVTVNYARNHTNYFQNLFMNLFTHGFQ